MRVLVLVLSIFCLSGYAQNSKDVQFKWPGFSQINDSVFISHHEISVRDYGEFLHLMKEYLGSYELFEKSFPKPNHVNWICHDPYQKQNFVIGTLYDVISGSRTTNMKSNIQNRPDTNVGYLRVIATLPIVNLTKEQALIYCELRTKAFTTLKKNTRKEKKWKLPDSVYFRLPTLEEWSQAVSMEFADYKQELKEKDFFISKDLMIRLNQNESLPYSVYSGHTNPKGIMNLCGNVSEMLMDSPYPVGGSYADSISECHSEIKSEVLPPHETIGFRVVAVIKKKLP